MPKRQLNYKGLDIHIDMMTKSLPYQVWVTESHVIAAASLVEVFVCVDAYLARLEAAA